MPSKKTNKPATHKTKDKDKGKDDDKGKESSGDTSPKRGDAPK